MNKDFNKEQMKSLLTRYPYLRIAFKAGLISRRLCKDMLGVTKGEMDDIYVDLIRYGAIKVLSSSAFRANEDTINLINQMEAEENDKRRVSGVLY